MSLQIWLPLTKDLRNNGCNGITVNNNGATINDSGKLGKCYYFNGSAQYLQFSETLGDIYTKDFSYAVWLKPTDSSRGIIISEYSSTGSSNVAYELTASRAIRLYWNGSPDIYPTNCVLPIDTWTHTAIVKRRNEIKFYINGELRYTYTGTLSDRISSSKIRIGDDYRGGTGVSYMGCMNDLRIYNHALSLAEIKEIAKGLCVHYKLDTPSSISNLIRNVSYSAYNNFASAGFTATIANTGRTYNSCKIYRLTYTPGSDTTKLNNVKSSLTSHGIMGFRTTFLANTKYCFWILCKPISHPDTVLGGTASNISGWTEIPMKKYNDDWFIVGQCRKGNVTENKTDSIFTSFKTPSAEAGVPITIDFCCPHLLEGYDTILPEYDYVGTEPNAVDSSGYGHHGVKSGNIQVSDDTARDSASYTFNGTDTFIESDPLPLETKTISIWLKTSWVSSSGYRLAVHDRHTGLAIGWSSNQLITYVGTGNGGVGSRLDITTTNYTANEWNHIVVVKTGDKTRDIYVNGVKSTPTSSNYWSGDQDTLNIGNRHVSGAYAGYFNGQISDFRAYSTELSADDILALYNVGARVANDGTMFGCEMKEG